MFACSLRDSHLSTGVMVLSSCRALSILLFTPTDDLREALLGSFVQLGSFVTLLDHNPIVLRFS